MHRRLIRQGKTLKHMNDQHLEEKQGISPVYVGDFNRITKAVETRCGLLGDTPRLGEIETQIALRAATAKIASLRRELTSVRAVITSFLEDEIWPEGIEEYGWLVNAGPEAIGQLHSGLVRTARDFTSLGQSIAEEMSIRALEMNFPGSQEDAIRALSGMTPERSKRKTRDKKGMQPITNADLMELELFFADHPHQSALKTLSLKRTDAKALLRIFMRVIRLTGMRPIEVFRCRILIGISGRDYSVDEISLINRSPYIAALTGLLKPMESETLGNHATLGEMVKTLCKTTGVPPVLLIEAAKTTNANPDLVRPYRAQVLKNIDDDDLEVLCLAAHLHHFKIEDKRRSNLITTMTRNLTAAAEKALPHRVDGMNLYSFRHDFATRARRSLELWEVAALMGHTAKASTYAYGKRHTRKKSGSSSSGGWMPAPDQEFAEAIREKWGITEVAPAEVSADPAADLARELLASETNFNAERPSLREE